MRCVFQMEAQLSLVQMTAKISAKHLMHPVLCKMEIVGTEIEIISAWGAQVSVVIMYGKHKMVQQAKHILKVNMPDNIDPLSKQAHSFLPTIYIIIAKTCGVLYIHSSIQCQMGLGLGITKQLELVDQ